jgi:hypothetical protein
MSCRDALWPTLNRSECENFTGRRVMRTVSIAGKEIVLGPGTVTRDEGTGTCEVDIMSLHGGAPWLLLESKASLRLAD